MFNAAVSDVVKDLIGCAAIALWNMEQTFHLADCEVGHAPGANLPRSAQTFEARYNPGKFGVPNWPVQQIEIEMISAEPGKARLTSTRDPISSHVIGLHLGDEEYAVALTGNHVVNQFLRTAAAVI